jgi:hypothetical protein
VEAAVAPFIPPYQQNPTAATGSYPTPLQPDLSAIVHYEAAVLAVVIGSARADAEDHSSHRLQNFPMILRETARGEQQVAVDIWSPHGFNHPMETHSIGTFGCGDLLR